MTVEKKPYMRPKNMLLFPEKRLRRNIFTWFFLNQFSEVILFFSLISFDFFVFLLDFFLLVCLILEIKNIFSDKHSTMQAGE